MTQHTLMLVALPIGAYLIGAIPCGLIIGKMRGVDIRRLGSGNIGATNVGRALGRKWGIVAFALDVAKGFVPTLVASRIVAGTSAAAGLGPLLQTILVLLVAAACVLGHVWPVYLRFRGGKGVATSLGAVLGYAPYLTLPGLAALATWGVMLALTRYVSASSIAGVVSFSVYLVGLGLWQGWDASRLVVLLVFSLVMAGLVVLRHRANISRLLAGTEPKIGSAAR